MVTQLPDRLPCDVRALYSWSGEQRQDLGFVEGDLIEVLDTGDGSWWTGRLKRNRTVGVFPSNFVEYVRPQTKLEQQQQPAPKSPGDFGAQLEMSFAGDLDLSLELNEFSDNDHSHDDESMEMNVQVSQKSLYEDDDPYQDSADYTSITDSAVDPRLRAPFDLDDLNISSNSITNTPLPPPHRVAVTPQTPSAPFTTLDRTPSPLRHAMDDVMASLHDMDLRSSQAAKEKDQDQDQEITLDTSVDLSLQESVNTLLHGRSQAGKRGEALSGIEDLSKVKGFSDMTLEEFSLEKDRRQTFHESHRSSGTMDSSWRPMSLHASMRKDSSTSALHASSLRSSFSSSLSDEFMPFDPDSYNAPTQAASQVSNQTLVHSRTDSLRESHRSLLSSTSSVTRIPSHLSMFGDFSVSEVPVDLPNLKLRSEEGRALKLKRSTGFLKRLFSGQKADKDNDENDLSLKRTVSRTSTRSKTSLHQRVRSLTSFVNLKAQQPTFGSTTWIDVRRDVHRANTLTAAERADRMRRRHLEGLLLLEPLKALNSTKGCMADNEQGLVRIDVKDWVKAHDFEPVVAFIREMRSWPQLMSPGVFASSHIGRRYDYELDRLRAVYEFCRTKISHDNDDNESDSEPEGEQDQDEYSVLNLLKTKRATPRELALCVKEMCEALDMPCLVVSGHLKGPGDVYDKAMMPPIDHYWNAVLTNGEWRLLDCSCSSPSFPRYETYRHDSYFLRPPNHFLYSHVPAHPHHQFLVPPVADYDALALPLTGAAAFSHDLHIVEYNTALVRLDNLEVVELDISVPKGVELAASVTVHDQTHTNLTVCQPQWFEGRRRYKVKAVLPVDSRRGVLNIYAGDRSSLSRAVDSPKSLSLAYALGITQTGQNAEFEFVTRHATPHCRRHDVYVTQPQTKKLIGGNVYAFSFRQWASGGAQAVVAPTKLALQTPSGKIVKLSKKVAGDGTIWEVSTKVMEVGTWRGLILADRGDAWSVFGEWFCI